MLAETRSRVGRHEPTSMSADTRPILHRHSAATRPILYQHLANSLGQLLLPPEFYLPCSTERGFQWPSSFFGLQLRQYSCLFPAMLFPRHRFYIRPSLLSDAAAFGDCCFWRLVVFGGAKDDIKSWYDCALFLPHRWVFFSSRPRDISQLFVA